MTSSSTGCSSHSRSASERGGGRAGSGRDRPALGSLGPGGPQAGLVFPGAIRVGFRVIWQPQGHPDAPQDRPRSGAPNPQSGTISDASGSLGFCPPAPYEFGGPKVNWKFTVAVWTALVSWTVWNCWASGESDGGTAVTVYVENCPKSTARSLKT